MTNYNDGKWHSWNGGECPVHRKTVVDALFRSGEAHHSILGEHLDWSGPDILPFSHVAAFRVIKEHREPREFWIDVRGIAWTDPRFAADAPKPLIHVREVMPDE